MHTLVIYDKTGKIWNITYGQYEVPKGLVAEVIDVPEGSQIERIDTSDDKAKIVYASLPDDDVRMLKAEVNNLRTENALMNTALTFVADTFTDEQALVLPTLYPNWEVGVDYKKDKRVRFNDVLYKVLSDHTSQADWTPESAPSLFAKVLVEDPNVITEWVQPDSTNGYSKGDKVTLEGVTYESQVDNNIWKPNEVGEDIWKVVTE